MQSERMKEKGFEFCILGFEANSRTFYGDTVHFVDYYFTHQSSGELTRNIDFLVFAGAQRRSSATPIP
jgi:hypothetical protein